MNGDNFALIDDCKNDFNKIEDFIKKDPLNSLCPYLISYSIIRACGCIEVCVKNILFDYLSKGAKAETVKYLENQILESSWNPSFGSIQKLLDAINPNWSSSFQSSLHGAKEKGDLTSLINLRNDFAHGQKVTATIGNIIEYFEGSCKVVENLNSIINTETAA